VGMVWVVGMAYPYRSEISGRECCSLHRALRMRQTAYGTPHNPLVRSWER
jgi:hypothetical protein